MKKLSNSFFHGVVCRLNGVALAVCLGLVVLVSAPRVVGQAVNGTLVGTITDSSGAVVAGARVTVTEQDQNVSRSTVTNDSGFYSFPDMSPGVYKVVVEKQGFRLVVRHDTTLDVSTTVRVDLTLQPGAVSETINVEATLPPLQTDSAQTGGELTSALAEDLPVNNGRNFQNLVDLVPGSTKAEVNHSVFFNPQGSRNNEVNGTSSMSNNFQIEGVNDNERTGLLQVYVPAIEAIQEVQILTSNYDAEQGTALGAVVNVIYKSGTNNFHGALYDFYNGSALNSKGWIPAQQTAFIKPHSVYNYWGGNIGGPIIKGKTFFFVDYLRTTNHSAQFQRLSVPTAAERAGDFSDFLNPATVKSPVPIFDPASGDTADCLPGGNSKLCGTGRAQFVASSNSASPNYNPACGPSTFGFNNGNCPNVIPLNRLDPIAAKLVALVRLPNNNLTAPGTGKYSQNFLESTAFRQDNNDVDVKIDHYQGKNDHLSGHFGYMNPQTFQAPAYGLAGGPIGGGFQGSGTDKTFSAAINWDHTFSSTFIVQNRVGLNRYRNTAQQNDYGSNASDSIGIPGVNVGAFESGLTGVQIGSTVSDPMVGYSASLPWVRAETDIDVVSNWNKVVGNHTIKWGGNLIRLRDDLLQEQTFSPRGLWNFASGQTSLNCAVAATGCTLVNGKLVGPSTGFANNAASFIVGVPNQVGRDLAIVFPAYREWQVFGYVNDKWQVKPKLTLNLGLRWEFYPPGTPHFPGGFSNYDPTTNNLVVAGIGGNPLDIGMQRNYHDFAPRIGVAYQLTSKDVVRAGYGISYEPFVDNTYAYDFPVKQNNAFNNLSNFGPAILPNGAASTFAGGFPAPLVASIPSNGIIPANTPLLINQNYDVINLKYVDPYVQSWNLTYERVLPAKLTLDLSYVGNRTVHAPIQYDLNAVSNPADIGLGSAGRPEIGTCVPGTTTCRTASSTVRFFGASADYNALQAKFNRNVSKGLTLTTSYTYGKALGYIEENGENSNGIDYYINFRRNYARADFDRTHMLVSSFIWDLPFGNGQRWVHGGPLNAVIGGWRWSNVVTFMTGSPMNFDCTCSSGLNTPGNHQTPWVTGPIDEPKGVDTQPWFDNSAALFVDPTKLFGKPTFGNIGRFSLSGPNFFNLDSSLAKNFRLTERFNFQFRTDWFSATDTPQFNNPDSKLGDANFGLVKGAGGARAIYLSGRLTF